MASYSLEEPGISDDRAAIWTYSNYSAAWCLRKDSEPTPRDAQSQLAFFSQSHPFSRYHIESVRPHLLRGALTLKLIREIPIDDNPDFAMVSALWLPVQAYYAVKGFGMAFLAAQNGPDKLPRSHLAFMRQAADVFVRRLLPRPFSSMAKGGYRRFKHLKPEFTNIHDEGLNIGSGLNLSRPNETTRDAHVVQCLDTTRERLIRTKIADERQKSKKPGRQRGVVRGDRQRQLAANVAPTTVFDYLYRVRIKSNYEDPTMYQVGTDDADAVLEFVRNTQELAITLCGLLAASLWEIGDNAAREKLKSHVEKFDLLEGIGRSYWRS